MKSNIQTMAKANMESLQNWFAWTWKVGLLRRPSAGRFTDTKTRRRSETLRHLGMTAPRCGTTSVALNKVGSRAILGLPPALAVVLVLVGVRCCPRIIGPTG